MIDQHRAAFREEARELLVELEASLLALEETPDDVELIGRVFRAMHTIKGSGAMFGFDSIAAFTHDVETVFDLVRKGELAVTPDLVNLSLAARDRIRTMLEDESVDGRDSLSVAILDGLRSLAARTSTGTATATTAPMPTPVAAPRRAEGPMTYRLRFRPPADIFRRGGDPSALIDQVRALGEAHAIVHTDAVPFLDAIDPEACYLYWDVVLTTTAGLDAIRDVFFFFEDGAELRIDVVDDGYASDEYKRIGEILLERGDVSATALGQAITEHHRRLGDVLIERGAVSASKVQAAVAEQEHIKAQRARRQAQAAETTTVRVPAERLDTLVNLIGEMVTVQARFSQTAVTRNDAELIAIAEEVERLTWELRDSAMNIRMLPIGTTFSKFKRLVHDLSLELGKSIDLVTDGAETELDKTVIEKLGDPLVHLIRNAIDHGIEMPDAREAAGKPGTGTVRLSAEHSGSHVLIRVADDGAGLDAAAIRAKAIERGLIAAGAELSERELFGLIMLPGFSTAKTVSNVSGRGVGMDVVKQAIEALSGAIEIASTRGAGTTFTVRIPLTLAIIDGLLVTIGEGSFVIPLGVVQECVELTRAMSERAHGRDVAVVRGQMVPYVRLRRQFGIDGVTPEIEQIVIGEFDGTRIGFVVDRIIGEHQTVIKSLGKLYKGVSGISGSTILGDGTVALILDAPQLVRAAEKAELALTH